MAEITSLFQRVWKNIWREKFLWLFSSLSFISYIVSPVFSSQREMSLSLSCLLFLGSLALMSLSYAGRIGVAYVASRVIVGSQVDVSMVFQAIRRFFWRVLFATLLFSLLLGIFVLVCLGLVFILFMEKLSRADLPLMFFIAIIFLSFFTAPIQFIFSEIIVGDSGIWKSIQNAWNLFNKNFGVLAVSGALLSIAFHIVNASMGMLIILFQHHFDLSALHGFSVFTPQLSLLNNTTYNFLVSAVFGTAQNTFSTCLFMLAYLKYKGQVE